jgi:hypothetical protein
VCIDFKQQRITLLQERATKASLRNVRVFYGRIETFSEPFDARAALHACGIAADLALSHALELKAAYVMSPCCVGKLQIPIDLLMINSAKQMKSQSEPGSVSSAVGTERTNKPIAPIFERLSSSPRPVDLNKYERRGRVEPFASP